MWKLHAAADDRRLRIVVEREAVSTAAVEYTVGRDTLARECDESMNAVKTYRRFVNIGQQNILLSADMLKSRNNLLSKLAASTLYWG